MYCISQNITGLKKDLIFDEDFNLIRNKRNKTDIIICCKTNRKSISYIAKQAGVDISLNIPTKFNNMWKFLNKTPDWSNILGTKTFVSMCRQLLRDTKKFVENKDYEYYHKYAPQFLEFVDSTSRAKVDEDNLLLYFKTIEPYFSKKIMSEIDTQSKEFKKIEYNLFNTATGRMTIDSGLNLLTLKKSNRNILKSTFDGGKILEIDIRNLEPRILMGMYRDDVPEDIYAWIKEENLSDMNIGRDTIKIMLFKIMYGASSNSIYEGLKQYGFDLADVKEMVARIKTSLCYNRLVLDIRSSIDDNGQFKNYYGRLLETSSADVNHYLQSTGVDVSILCFKKIDDVLKTTDLNYNIVGFIHDAMILDCDSKAAEAVIKNMNEKNIKVEGFNNCFPIIITEVK